MLNFSAKEYLLTLTRVVLFVKHYCHYHSISPAIWHCNACGRYYDKRCIPDGDEKLGKASCPHCRIAMKYLEKRHNMESYWQVKGRFFRLPFSTEVLFIIILNALLSLSFQLHKVLACLCGALMLLLLVNYAARLSRNIARGGKMHGTSTDIKLYNESKHLPGMAALVNFNDVKDSLILSLMLVIMLFLPVLMLYYLSPISSVIFLLFTLPFLPALLLMALYQDTRPLSRRTSATPSVFDIIQKMGAAYCGLVAYIATFFLAVLLCFDLTGKLGFTYLNSVLTSVLVTYFVIVFFSLLGYVLRRYDAFSKNNAPASGEHAAFLHDKRLCFDADLDIAVKEGDYAQAITLLEECLKKGGRTDRRVEQLYRLLIEHKDYKRLERFSHLILELQLGRGQDLAAYEFIEMLRNENSEYYVYDLPLRAELAEAFYRLKEYALVVWLVSDAQTRYEFEPRYKDSDDLAKLYLRVAKTLLAKSGTPEKATPYLEYVVQRFPDTEFKQSAERLLQHMREHAKKP